MVSVVDGDSGNSSRYTADLLCDLGHVTCPEMFKEPLVALQGIWLATFGYTENREFSKNVGSAYFFILRT